MPEATKIFAPKFELLAPAFKQAVWKATRKYLIIGGAVGILIGGIVIGAVLPIGTAKPPLITLGITPGKRILTGSQMLLRK